MLEALKQHHENKEIIDAERGLNGVAGDKFKGRLAALRHGDPAGKAGGGQHQDCRAQPCKGLGVASFAAVAGEQPVPHQKQHHHNVKPHPPNPGDTRDHSWMLQHRQRGLAAVSRSTCHRLPCCRIYKVRSSHVSELTRTEQQDQGRIATAPHRPRVVIVGGGFAGIHAARGLAHLPVDVTVLDRRNHHLFQPLLYQVALAVLSPADIAQPIRTILRHQANTEVLMDEVVGIDVAARQVALASGSRMDYDYLVLATGATHSYFGHAEWAPLAPGLKTIEDATEIRRRVLLAFELAERQMVEHGWHPPLNFVVIGGGPTGVELAGAISDIAQLYMRHDFRHIDPTKSRVMLLEGSPRVLAAYPADLSAKAEARCTSWEWRSIPTRRSPASGRAGWRRRPSGNGNERIEAAVTLWAAGVQASPLGKMLGAPPGEF